MLKTLTTPDGDEVQVVEYGYHGVHRKQVVDRDGFESQQATVPAPFEIEIGSPVYERLLGQGKLPAPGLHQGPYLDDAPRLSEAALEGQSVGELKELAASLGIEKPAGSKAKLIEQIKAEHPRILHPADGSVEIADESPGEILVD
jgi:hypothetical protein